jgi:hypothetical protein
MILSFNPQFVPKVKNGKKKLTIRLDAPKRWKPGTTIHFWNGNPRNTKRVPKPNCFGVGIVCAVADIEIGTPSPHVGYVPITLNGKPLTSVEIAQIATADGFSTPLEFVNYHGLNFKGRVIEWSNTVFY